MSNNLDISQVATNQAQKEATINEASGQLDAALTESFTCDLTSTDVTLTDTQFRRHVRFLAMNAADAGRIITVPAVKRWFIVTSAATNSENITVKRGTAEFVIEPGMSGTFYTDGTANGLVEVASGGGGGGGGGPLTLAVYVQGLPGDAERIMRFIATGDFSIPANFAGSQVDAETPPADADAEFVVGKNGSSIGTITIEQTTGTVVFDLTGGASFTAGDLLEILAPTPQDSALADISLSIVSSA